MLRSHSYALLVNGAAVDEIKSSITDATADDLAVALAAVMAEMEPASDVEIAAALSTICALLGQDWAVARRDEFIAIATLQLCEYPAALLLDALHRAAKRVTAGRLLIPWIAEDVEPRAGKLALERDRLTRLVEIMVSAG